MTVADKKYPRNHSLPNASFGRQKRHIGGYPDLRVVAAISAFPVNTSGCLTLVIECGVK